MRLTILGIVAAVIVFGAAYVFVNPSTQTASALVPTNAQSTIIFDTSEIVALLKQLLSIHAAAPSVTVPFATSTPTAKATAAPSTTATPAKKPFTTNTSASSATASAPATPAQSPTQKALGLVLPTLRSALVNIVCLPNSQGTLKGISGSGIIISPNGIILTVAHVAQYELIAEARPDLMTCYVRAGSPATYAYKAHPIYVSSAWVAQNSHIISSSDPTGTGQNDFALLAITSSDTNTPLPSTYTYVPLWNGISNIGDPVVIGSYGAEFLTTAAIRSDLFPTLVYDTVHDRFTFGTNTVDLMSLGGNAAAQQGSSGGGIANQSGQLVGLITTSSSGTDLSTRDLHAITSSYILRAFQQESGTDLNSYISNSNTATLVNSYASKASTLANTLISANGIN